MPTTQLVGVNGVTLLVRTVGFGPDVVVLHGGPGADHASLLPAFDALARDRRLRYYDQRGGGGSRAPARAPLGWHDHVSDLHELLGRWQIAQATLLGYSWGGLLALLFATRFPDRVARLALVCPAPVSAEGRADFEQRLVRRLSNHDIVGQRAAILRSGLLKRDPAAFQKRSFELTITAYLRDPSRARLVPPFRLANRAREAIWRSLGNYDLRGELATLGVPALVVHGRYDPIPIEASCELAAILGARLEVFEDSGHLPFLEEFNRFVRVLDGFLPCDTRRVS